MNSIENFELQKQAKVYNDGVEWVIPTAPTYGEHTNTASGGTNEWAISSPPNYKECVAKASLSDHKVASMTTRIIIAVTIVTVLILAVLAIFLACFFHFYFMSTCEKGKCVSKPLPSCSSLPKESASGYYWVKSSDGHAVEVFCDRSEPCEKGECVSNPLPSCSSLPKESASGYYWVNSSDGHAVEVFCDTSEPCGSPGSWMRVVKLDMDKHSNRCPKTLCLDTNYKRRCRICTYAPSCSSEVYNTEKITYSKVCGKIIAYQIGTPNAFFIGLNKTAKSINEIYVDGVSLTHGRPRKHIWTFAADHTENYTFLNGCPCNSYLQNPTNPPDFVSNDYFCDTADTRGLQYNIIFIGDPLWDGTGCGHNNDCCSFNQPPWFYKKLPASTVDNIEMRVCRGGYRNNEDIALKIVEIYVQ